MIIGHASPIVALLDTAHGARLHHAWLFIGPQGVGKALVAQAAAARLLAASAGPPPLGGGLTLDPDHPTARLIAAGAHSDYIWIERLENDKGVKARNISVSQIRALGSKFSLAPSQGSRRIVVIDAVDDLEKGAANALLKALEEPPAHTLFFLISHAPGRLLPTIRSRCRVLRFAPLSDDEMRAVLHCYAPEAGEQELTTLLAMAKGAPGKALALAGLDIAGIDVALQSIARTGDPYNQTRTALASQFATKASQARYEALLKHVPQFIAAQARVPNAALSKHLTAYQQAVQLSATALVHSVDPQAAVFEMGSIVAGLAK